MVSEANRTSIWVLCEDCGHVSRVLSVMANRVLRDRKSCPQCHSFNAPTLHYTAIGTHLHVDDAPSGAHVRSTAAELRTSPEWAPARSVRSFFADPLSWLRGTHF